MVKKNRRNGTNGANVSVAPEPTEVVEVEEVSVAPETNTTGGKRNKNRNKTVGGKRRNKTVGGKRKTRKMSKGASQWNRKVMEIYRKLKKSNPATKLGDAMKHAAALKKKGQL